MSDAATPNPAPARRSPLATFGFCIRAGWRPFSGWCCGGVILVNGVIVPVARMHDASIPVIDWHGLTPFAAILLGQAAIRGWEKIKGVAD